MVSSSLSSSFSQDWLPSQIVYYERRANAYVDICSRDCICRLHTIVYRVTMKKKPVKAKKKPKKVEACCCADFGPMSNGEHCEECHAGPMGS